MTAETPKVYAPCPKHRLWHDLERECFYCAVEQADAQPLPEVRAMTENNLKCPECGHTQPESGPCQKCGQWIASGKN